MNPYQPISQAISRAFEEDDDPAVAYAALPMTRFCDNRGDGRGYTCNIPRKAVFGCTTADEEVVAVVEAYTKLRGINHLALMSDELRKLRDEGSDDVTRLDELGFKEHWRNACSNRVFLQAYGAVGARIFGVPTEAHVAEQELALPVAWAIIFDTVIQHGNDKDDPDSIWGVLHRAKINRHFAHSETEFLTSFLESRKETLLNAHEQSTRREWKGSASRVDALQFLVDVNPHLQAPVRIKSAEYDEVISA